MTSTTKRSQLDDSSSTHGDNSRDAVTIECGEDRLFTSDFVFATLANFANAFGMQMLVATLPVYVRSDFVCQRISCIERKRVEDAVGKERWSNDRDYECVL